MNIDKQIRQWAQMILEESEDYRIDERINPNGTIDDMSNEDEIIEGLVKNAIHWLLNLDHNINNEYTTCLDPSFSEDNQQLNMRVSGYGTFIDFHISFNDKLMRTLEKSFLDSKEATKKEIMGMLGRFIPMAVKDQKHEIERELNSQFRRNLKPVENYENSYIPRFSSNAEIQLKHYTFEKAVIDIETYSEEIDNLKKHKRKHDSKYFRKNLHKPNLPQESQGEDQNTTDIDFDI